LTKNLPSFRLNETAGQYSPGFMYIMLDSMEHNVLFHEYIHHIQNVTQFYNLHYFLALKSYFLEMALIRRGSPDLAAKIRETYFKTLEIACGSFGRRMDIRYNNVTIDSVSYKELNGFPAILSIWLTVDGKNRVFEFGTIAIQEGLASILETCFYPHAINPYLTYNICELLILHHCPKLKDNKIAIVGIMELSMLSAIPINTLMHLMHFAKSLDKEDVSKGDLLDAFFSLLMTDVLTDKPTQLTIPEICDVYMTRIDRDISNFYDLLKLQDEPNQDIFAEWQKNILKQGLLYRRDNSLLFSDMANLTPKDANPIYDAIKIPLVVLGDYSDIHFTDESMDSNLLLFLGEEEVFTKLQGDIQPCRLISICKKYVRNVGRTGTASMSVLPTEDEDKVAMKDVYNKSCSSPTNRDRNNNLCPFSFIWRKVVSPSQD